MKYCINCGTQLPDEAKFCVKCGTPQPVAEAKAEPAPAPVVEQAPEVTPTPVVQPVENKPEEPQKQNEFIKPTVVEEQPKKVRQKTDFSEVAKWKSVLTASLIAFGYLFLRIFLALLGIGSVFFTVTGIMLSALAFAGAVIGFTMRFKKKEFNEEFILVCAAGFMDFVFFICHIVMI